jgi:SPP1 family predicted phage head-tail adaptor
MLPAGLFNKHITLQHLKKEKDVYGSENETWVDEITCRCRVVTPSMADNRHVLNNEVVITDRLIFQTRKWYNKHFSKYSGLKHRILYRCRPYQILSMDDEGNDLIIMAELIED